MNCYTEIFDLERLNHILKYKKYYATLLKTEEGYNPFDMLKKYKSKAGGPYGNYVCVNYEKANGRGRLNACGGLSLQCFHSKIRGSIAGDLYYDIDFVNCHPVILDKLVGDHGMVLNSLKDYIVSRDIILNEINKLNPEKSKKFIKKSILSAMYCGLKDFDSIKNKTVWMNAFKEDMAVLHSKVAVIFSEDYELRKKIKGKGYFNLEGSALSSACQVVENELLQIMVECFKNNGLVENFLVLTFDGMMVLKKRKEKKIKIETLNEAIEETEKLIKEKGYNIKIKIKDFEKLPEDIPYEFLQNLDDTVKDEAIYDYINGDYYWYDFIKDMSVLHDGFEDMCEVFKKNINRVSVCVFQINDFIRKLNKDNLFDIIKSDTLVREVFTYMNVSPRGEVTISKINMYALLYKIGLANDIKRYNVLDFKPSTVFAPLKDVDARNLNSWVGFKSKLIPKDKVDKSKIDIILNHILKCWAADNIETYNYILAWFKHIFMKPSIKSKVAIVLKSSEQQIGKGIIINEFLIPFVFGGSYSISVSGINVLTKRFNDILMNKLLINCDELSALDGTGYHQSFDTLKKKITDNTIDIEIKRGACFVYPDYSNYIFCTNNDFTIKVEAEDARYAIFQCSPCFQKNKPYFDLLKNSLNQENADHFYSYLCYLENDIDILKIPNSELKKDMQISSLQSPSRFLLEISNGEYVINCRECGCDLLVENEECDDLDHKNSCVKGFYNSFLTWCDINKEKVVTNTKFGNDIKGKIKKIKSRYVTYMLDSIKVF